MDITDIESMTTKYIEKVSKQTRAEYGQFFTDYQTAEYMADCLSYTLPEITILDLGFGAGILSYAVVNKAIANGVKKISLTAAENDSSIFSLMHDSVEIIRSLCVDNGVEFSFTHISKDYITFCDERKYDIVISNPPYRKIRHSSPDAQAMKNFLYGQPNLYSLFMVKGLEALKLEGQFVYITPRSWTAGQYFVKVRKFIEDSSSIKSLTLFKNRNESFSSDDILQETMITYGIKGTPQCSDICVTLCNGYKFDNMHSFNVDASVIIEQKGERRLFIPEDNSQLSILDRLSHITTTLSDLGYLFKTGPVVEFRNKDFISPVRKNGYVPMVRGINISHDGDFIFPANTTKDQYADGSKGSLLVPDSNTIFVRRLSAKEDKRRVSSCVYHGKGSGSISIENHVNYLTRADGSSLSDNEVNSIQKVLSSDEYDTYFRMFGGSTQVNAADLNSLPIEREAILV